MTITVIPTDIGTIRLSTGWRPEMRTKIHWPTYGATRAWLRGVEIPLSEAERLIRTWA